MSGLIAGAWRIAATVAAPGLRLMLRRRVISGKEVAARLPEREGIDGALRPAGRLLWLHAASVGETVSVLPVLSSLARGDPAVHVLFTTGTLTSARLLERRLPELGLEQVTHRFVPLDVPGWVDRFLDHWRPGAAAFVESELWPNLIAACRRRGIPMMLVNGRMSARSFRNWRLVAGFAREMIGAFDRVHAQSDDYAARLRELGARRLEPPGNLKLASPRLEVDPAEAARLQAAIGSRPRWLAACTHPGEEALIGAVHRELLATYPDLLTIVAPRHAERGAAASAELGGAPRRSLGEPPPAGGIWVADTMGELGLLYSLSPIVFMGKSLVGRGGQNPLEPARFGCAIAVGPHTENFRATMDGLQQAGGLARVGDGPALARWVHRMLSNDIEREQAGGAAQSVADGESALPDRVARSLLDLLGR